MDFSKSMAVAASGMRAQTDRMKTIAENIANASSTSPVKGADPYRRKIATIKPDFAGMGLHRILLYSVYQVLVISDPSRQMQGNTRLIQYFMSRFPNEQPPSINCTAFKNPRT